MLENITSAVNSKTGETISLGDRVVIYQGRFGHNNIITIRTMFKVHGQVYVSHREKATVGTYLEAIKRKITEAELHQIRVDLIKGKAAAQYQIIS